jgi:uncharacterized protein
MIDPRLLEILRCPHCEGRVSAFATGVGCASCGREYPLRYGLPFLIAEPGTAPPPPPPAPPGEDRVTDGRAPGRRRSSSS